MLKIYIILLIVMSLITFIMYGIDKFTAKHDKYRIPEKVLLGLSILFGSVGGTLGMYLFHHKTKHWYFVVINFISLVVHTILLLLLIF